MKQNLAMREYPWGLSKIEADMIVGLVSSRGYGTIIEALADCAYDNGDSEICDSLRRAATNLRGGPAQ